MYLNHTQCTLMAHLVNVHRNCRFVWVVFITENGRHATRGKQAADCWDLELAEVLDLYVTSLNFH